LPIKKAFRMAEPAASGEERLWRERAARMTLDALGHTNLTVKPNEHNEAVRYARRWFRGIYLGAPESDDPQATFDAAAILFSSVREAVLDTDPIIFEPAD
jgi:hypothetical protein